MGEKKRRQLAGQLPKTNTGSPKAGRLLKQAEQYLKDNRKADAKRAFEEVLAIEPHRAEAWRGLGAIAVEAGAYDAAMRILEKALDLDPSDTGSRIHYARTLQQTDRMDDACKQWLEVCALRPDDSYAWESLGIALQAIGEVDEAEKAYGKALELRPSLGLRAKLATLVAPIVASREAIRAERARMEERLDVLIDQPLVEPTLADPMQAALWTNFFLAYHGLPNCDLQCKTAEMYRRIVPSLDYVAAHCGSDRRPKGKIRIGLISQFFYNHSIGRTSRGLFAHLDKETFDVSAIFIAPTVEDDYSRFIRQHANRSIVVPQDLPAARRQIENLQLDILFYQDIGMEPFSYFLAYSRLAPVQCVSFGHPDTTGIPTIDYFISNDGYETADGASHYSERLCLLHDLGSLAYYYKPELPAIRKTRADYGWNESDHLYLCPQNLFKVHPDMDDLIAGILHDDEMARVVLISGRTPNWTELLRRRWSAVMPDEMTRIEFLPRMDSGDYLNLIALSDVMLDTVHFNGMNTSLEALSVATPVITLPTELQRGRHTQAMYRRMGLSECVADNQEDYVARAIKVASDADYRNRIRERILETNACLFEDDAVIREFERCFIAMARSQLPSQG